MSSPPARTPSASPRQPSSLRGTESGVEPSQSAPDGREQPVDTPSAAPHEPQHSGSEGGHDAASDHADSDDGSPVAYSPPVPGRRKSGVVYPTPSEKSVGGASVGGVPVLEPALGISLARGSTVAAPPFWTSRVVLLAVALTALLTVGLSVGLGVGLGVGLHKGSATAAADAVPAGLISVSVTVVGVLPPFLSKETSATALSISMLHTSSISTNAAAVTQATALMAAMQADVTVLANLFVAWSVLYGKNYADLNASTTAFEAFEAAVSSLVQTNSVAVSGSWSGLNHLSGTAVSELDSTYRVELASGGKVPTLLQTDDSEAASSADGGAAAGGRRLSAASKPPPPAATFVNWATQLNLTAVKDQGQCGR